MTEAAIPFRVEIGEKFYDALKLGADLEGLTPSEFLRQAAKARLETKHGIVAETGVYARSRNGTRRPRKGTKTRKRETEELDLLKNAKSAT